MASKKSSEPIWIGHDRRGWNHARIDKDLLVDDKLGAYEIAVYVGLAMHAEAQTGRCFPSLATLGKYIRASEPTVRAALKVLIDTGYVTCERHRGKATEYWLEPLPLIHTPKAAFGVEPNTPQADSPHPQSSFPQPPKQLSTNKNKELVTYNEEDHSEAESVDIPATLSQLREKLWPRAAGS